jgi:ribosomal protein S27E
MEQQDGTITRAQLRGYFLFITCRACVQTNSLGSWGQTPSGCPTRMHYLVTRKGNRLDPLVLLYG